jgi:hypothetical protein
MSKKKATVSALLTSNEQRSDNSLRGKSLQRALQTGPPKTLTPYEWEQWYAEHGVPQSHIRASEPSRTEPAPSKPWWRWW